MMPEPDTTISIRPRKWTIWRPRARKLADQAPETYLIFNNHPRGQAVANALEMLERLTEQRPALPECLKQAFPRLAYF